MTSAPALPKPTIMSETKTPRFVRLLETPVRGVAMNQMINIFVYLSVYWQQIRGQIINEGPFTGPISLVNVSGVTMRDLTTLARSGQIKAMGALRTLELSLTLPELDKHPQNRLFCSAERWAVVPEGPTGEAPKIGSDPDRVNQGFLYVNNYPLDRAKGDGLSIHVQRFGPTSTQYTSPLPLGTFILIEGDMSQRFPLAK